MSHAKYSASAAHRWLNCTASIKATQDSVQTTSKYAAEGHRVHEFAAALLSNNNNETSRLLQERREGDNALWEAAGKYVRDVRDRAGEGATILVEKKVFYGSNIGASDDEAYGTADAIVIRPCGELQIHDLKYGAGKKVSVERNPQLMLYALGALDAVTFAGLPAKGYNFERIVLYIHQPRNGGISSYETTPDELRSFVMRAALAVKEEQNNPQYRPGVETCRWCANKANCNALYQFTVQSLGIDFDDLGATQSVDNIPISKLAAIIRQAPLTRAFLEAVEQRIHELMVQNRVPVPGLKLVAGRSGMRRWAADTPTLERVFTTHGYLPDQIYESVLVSPAKAEKLLRKDSDAWSAVQKHIVQPSASPVIALEDDPRPAYADVAGFENLNESEP